MVTKQPRSAHQSEPVCYKCNKKGSLCFEMSLLARDHALTMQQEIHYARECPIKPDTLVLCTYCHRRGHRAVYLFVRSNNEAVDKQDVGISRTNSADDSFNNVAISFWAPAVVGLNK